MHIIDLPSLEYIKAHSTTANPIIGLPKNKNPLITSAPTFDDKKFKQCPKCQQVKPLREFYTRRPRCRTCEKVAARNNYAMRVSRITEVKESITEPYTPSWDTFEDVCKSICHGIPVPADKVDWFFDLLKAKVSAKYPHAFMTEDEIRAYYVRRYWNWKNSLTPEKYAVWQEQQRQWRKKKKMEKQKMLNDTL